MILDSLTSKHLEAGRNMKTSDPVNTHHQTMSQTSLIFQSLVTGGEVRTAEGLIYSEIFFFIFYHYNKFTDIELTNSIPCFVGPSTSKYGSLSFFTINNK